MVRSHYCLIRETYFNNSNLSYADFSLSDLRGSTFHKSDLSHADFRDATNYSINPMTNTLKKTKFSKPEVLALLNAFDIIIE